MKTSSRLLLRFARIIAGRSRREWIDAMEIEAATDRPAEQEWAMGSVLAALRDRGHRDGNLWLAIILTPVIALLVCLLLFFPMSRLFMAGWLPSWVYNVVMLLVPLPFAWLLGRIRPKATIPAIIISYAIFWAVPLLAFWAGTGSPLIFFAPDAILYGMPNYLGLGSSLLVWIAGAWLGSRSWRAAAST